MNTKALGELLKWPELTEIDSVYNHVLGGHRKENDKISLSFSVKQVDYDTSVNEINAFTHWVDLLDKPKLMKYDRPSHIIHVGRLNCKQGI